MEVLILVMVVSLFVVSLLPLITENMVANNKTKIRMAAYEAAHKKVEDLRNTDFGTLASGTFTTPTVTGGSGIVTISKDINGDSVDETDIVKVKVDVNYPDKGQTKTITITTLIAK